MEGSDPENAPTATREDLIDLLNEDLAREYQAIISYVVYSQVIKGAQYMNIAAELVKHAGQELQHALTIAKQIDYLGGMPKVMPKSVKTSEKGEDMLRFDLENENETIRNYRQRVRQWPAGWAEGDDAGPGQHRPGGARAVPRGRRPGRDPQDHQDRNPLARSWGPGAGHFTPAIFP